MKILAIESSCDETAVSVVEDGRTVLSNCVASQIEMHTIYGGVVPEIASRKHVEAITALTDQALADASITKKDVDAIAVTYAPGLIGAVPVGVNFAKGAAMSLGVPLVPVYCGGRKKVFRRTTIILGQPFMAEIAGRRPTSEETHRISEELMARIYGLKETAA